MNVVYRIKSAFLSLSMLVAAGQSALAYKATVAIDDDFGLCSVTIAKGGVDNSAAALVAILQQECLLRANSLVKHGVVADPAGQTSPFHSLEVNVEALAGDRNLSVDVVKEILSGLENVNKALAAKQAAMQEHTFLKDALLLGIIFVGPVAQADEHGDISEPVDHHSPRKVGRVSTVAAAASGLSDGGGVVGSIVLPEELGALFVDPTQLKEPAITSGMLSRLRPDGDEERFPTAIERWTPAEFEGE